MSEPIVFISHFRIKEGGLDTIRTFAREVFERMEADKPRTLAVTLGTLGLAADAVRDGGPGADASTDIELVIGPDFRLPN